LAYTGLWQFKPVRIKQQQLNAVSRHEILFPVNTKRCTKSNCNLQSFAVYNPVNI